VINAQGAYHGVADGELLRVNPARGEVTRIPSESCGQDDERDLEAQPCVAALLPVTTRRAGLEPMHPGS
jgi:hypothetical protein